MPKVILRKSNRDRRILKIRETISGTMERPRLSVFKSVRYIYAQLIDDVSKTVVADVSNATKKLHATGNKVAASFEVGKLLAERAIAKGVKKIIFDRRGYRYHGRVKSLADGARAGGLEF